MGAEEEGAGGVSGDAERGAANRQRAAPTQHGLKLILLKTCLSIHANKVESSDIQCVAASRNSDCIAKVFTLTGVYQLTAAPSAAGSSSI